MFFAAGLLVTHPYLSGVQPLSVQASAVELDEEFNEVFESMKR